MNSFTHACSFSLSFSLFSFSLTLTLRDWGFPVTWALSSPLLNLSLVLHHFCFSLSLTSFSVSLEPWLSILHALSLSLSLLSFALLYLRVSWAYYINVFAVCLWQGSLTGRKTGWWPLRSWMTQVRSGASGAHGEHMFPIALECHRTPIHCLIYPLPCFESANKGTAESSCPLTHEGSQQHVAPRIWFGRFLCRMTFWEETQGICLLLGSS